MAEPFDETWFHAPLASVGDAVALPKEEAHHLRQVLRIRPGRSIVVTNGRGTVFVCDTEDQAGTVRVSAREIFLEQPVPSRVHAVLGLLKGKDTEEPVEGICQLDVAAIHLVTTDHTQEFKGQDHGRLLERLKQKSLVALKQSKKAWLTDIHPPVPLREWRRQNSGSLVLVHPGSDCREFPATGLIHILTGPEGGFSGSEIDWLLREERALTLGLGPTRIRGTHAPLLAIGKLMGLGVH